MEPPAVRPAVRHARAADLARIQAIEDAGVPLFEEQFGDLTGDVLASPGDDGRDRVGEPGYLLVSGPVGEPVGFAHVVYVDGLAHLAQLSVLPTEARRGVGSALVREALAEAWHAGFDRMTLTTYRDVPFNGPFYARLGFEEAGETEPFLRRQRDHERSLGLDRHGPRVVMVARLGRPRRP
ncbi:GCN5 family N-acetyltransferase [Nocardioides szechwanensis]|uniref:Ribosomal protein S18 acetylase RimI n=1 Tax=Nocardioides szechwanensis TaxID=1005944 RepID=A0A1H0IE18_9ACTN|nr:GNAT family N-acetyltransferase [Nocardioides szechwanensis]GEP34479.1 GCN5 family N-acetyltransferase [Nocardioides szechwanensis]SDO29632.1 Ribosomal protein S18 acetylase RimI [Nocardioides szechwanensis]